MMPDFTFCVAPMMAWTDRHERYFLRLISRHVRLYTEMLTANAVVYGDRARLLAFDASEHPLALQLGGSEPSMLADAAAIGAAHGYDEINFNVGCPSVRVQSADFGACLMRTPQIVAACVEAMMARVSCSVSVKCRLGVDEQDPQDALFALLEACVAVGVRHFIIHARKAWLTGLDAKANREIPPLDYALVYAAKRAYPDCTIVINGGITCDDVPMHLEHVDGVMLGRAAYKNPYCLADIDSRFFDATARVSSRADIIDAFIPYIERQLADGVPLHAMTRHILGLYAGQPHGKYWRHVLGCEAHQPNASADIVRMAAEHMQTHIQSHEHSRGILI